MLSSQDVFVSFLDWSANELSKLTNRLAVILVDLVFLSLRCEIDLPNVVKKKIIKNGLKYPVGLSNGSSKKYTELNGKLVMEYEENEMWICWAKCR